MPEREMTLQEWVNRLPECHAARKELKRINEGLTEKVLYDKCVEQRAKLALVKEALGLCLPIVSAAYWDEHSAGIICGSGYNNKAQHLAGQQFGWRDNKNFKEWETEIRKAVDNEVKWLERSIGSKPLKNKDEI